MPITSKHAVPIALSLILSVAAPATAWAGKDYSTVNKSLKIDAGESVGDLESVNGTIRVGAGSVSESIQSVNGAIDLGEDAKVEQDVQAVNGTIELARGTDIGGNLETVNGTIRVRAGAVAGDVETVNGRIILLDGTVVEGNVLVKRPRGWSSDRKPVKVEIGENVKIHGDLIFEQPVRLRLHESASFREMIGDDIDVTEG